MPKGKFCVICMVVFLLSFHIACKLKETHRPGGPYYFKSFANFHRPFLPVEEIASEKTVGLAAYYIAYYDEKSRIIAFVKYIHGAFTFCDLYYYYPSGGLERIESYSSEAKSQVFYYNEKGKIIKIVPPVPGKP